MPPVAQHPIIRRIDTAVLVAEATALLLVLGLITLGVRKALT